MKPQIRRHEKITALVREHGFMSVEQLARELEVTPQTIRRDIGILSAENVLRRYHGGAALGEVLLEGEFGQGGRHSRREEKNAIAQLIAAHIPDNASLFISIGTTMEAVAAALIKQRKNLRIITNNIYVAALASARSDYTVIITSGVVRPLDGGVTGVATVDFINQFKVDYAVLSTHGVEGDGSLLDYDYKEVSVMQAMKALRLRGGGERRDRLCFRRPLHGRSGERYAAVSENHGFGLPARFGHRGVSGRGAGAGIFGRGRRGVRGVCRCGRGGGRRAGGGAERYVRRQIGGQPCGGNGAAGLGSGTHECAGRLKTQGGWKWNKNGSYRH